jgi:fucose 4-O-acetylase-like acetyltransferase
MAATRNRYLDALKGYAILMVVVGHAIQRSEAFGVVSAAGLGPYMPFWGYVTMPLFLAVSGFLSYGRIGHPLGPWLLRKARMLLVPCAAWTLLYYLLVHDGLLPTALPFGQYVWTQLRFPSLWYLAVLFECYCLLAIASKTGEWSLPLLAVLVLFLPKTYIETPGWYASWFVAGYFLAKWAPLVTKWRWVAWIVAPIVYVGGLVYFGGSLGFASRLLFGVLAAVTATLIVHLLGRTIVGRGLEYMGVHSLVIYVGQFLFLQFVLAPGWANPVVTTVLAILGSLGIEFALRRVPLLDAVLFGGRARRAPRTAAIGRTPATEL